MTRFKFTAPKIAESTQFVLVVLLWAYFFVNIENAGDFGSGLPLLVAYVFVGLTYVFLKYLRNGVRFRFHFILFLVLVFWVAIRYLLDRDDLYALKQITVATTGGMLLFFILGLLLNETLTSRRPGSRYGFLPLNIIYVLCIVWVISQFSTRLRIDLLLLDDLEGAYQRPGNFISMGFIVLSLFYVLSNVAIQIESRFNIHLAVSTAGYIVAAALSLAVSQLMGSNSSTAVVGGLTLLTMSVCLAFSSRRIFEAFQYFGHQIFRSDNLVRIIGRKTFWLILLLALMAGISIYHLGIDITKINLFGFGEGEVSSVNSRMEILRRWGVEQLSYAPIFGNVNVAYLVTGDPGTTLHNFFPDVVASLGIVGLVLVLLVFSLVFFGLLRIAHGSVAGYYIAFAERVLAIYSLLVLVFIIVFANISVGFSWPVLWFAIGFLSNALSSARSDPQPNVGEDGVDATNLQRAGEQ